MMGGSERFRKRAAFVLALVLGWPLSIPAGPPMQTPEPARRLVATAPHLVEMVYRAGSGDLLVGVDAASDYPPAARALPRVGGLHGLNLEAIVALRPDLVLVWKSGTAVWQVDRLRSAGLQVWVSETRRLEDIPAWFRQFGAKTGRKRQAEIAALEFESHLKAITPRAGGRPVRRVFLQVLDRSLFTLNDRHVVSDILRRCGGRNVMGHLPALAPRIEVESVLAADPEVIIASGDPRLWPAWQERWRRYPGLSAVRQGRMVYIPPDLLHRPGPRLLDGMERVCAALRR